jgi:hypothetical protein
MYADRKAEALAINIHDGTGGLVARAERLGEGGWGVVVELDEQTPVHVQEHGHHGFLVTAPGREELPVDSFPALRAALIAMHAENNRSFSP